MTSDIQARASALAAKVAVPQACTAPDNYWITMSGVDTQTSNMIYSSSGGNAWICYEWNGTQTAPTLQLFTYVDGNWQEQDLNTGQTTFTTDSGFFIYFDLGSSGADIKLGYSVS